MLTAHKKSRLRWLQDSCSEGGLQSFRCQNPYFRDNGEDLQIRNMSSANTRSYREPANNEARLSRTAQSTRSLTLAVHLEVDRQLNPPRQSPRSRRQLGSDDGYGTHPHFCEPWRSSRDEATSWSNLVQRLPWWSVKSLWKLGRHRRFPPRRRGGCVRPDTLRPACANSVMSQSCAVSVRGLLHKLPCRPKISPRLPSSTGSGGFGTPRVGCFGYQSGQGSATG